MRDEFENVEIAWDSAVSCDLCGFMCCDEHRVLIEDAEARHAAARASIDLGGK